MVLEALERRLSEAPEDRDAWLVYADSLLAHGDVRGELVRLELEAASVPTDNQRRRRLNVQARALIKRHEEAWRGGLPAHAQLTWAHGFVTGVWLPWEEDALTALGRFVAGPHARLLAAVGFRFDHRAPPELVAPLIDQLGTLELPTVRTLRVSHVRLLPEVVRALARAKVVPRLAHLDLRYAALGDEGLAALLDEASLERLQRLSLQKNQLSGQGMARLARAPLRALRQLDLRLNALGREGAVALSGAAFLPQLTHVTLYPEDLGREGVGVLAAAPNLPFALRRAWRALATALEPA
jgi:uncharacterized protein (TIGR02996 family)